MGFKEKEGIPKIALYAQTLIIVWHFCSSKSFYKIEKIKERALRLLHNDFASDYAELLKRSGKVTMEIKRLRMPCNKNIQNYE